MKILYVTTVSSTVDAFLVPHIQMLVDGGNKVDVAFKINKPLRIELKKIVTNIYNFNFNRSPLKNNYIKIISRLRDLINNEDYDIVHTHTPIASAIVRLACRNLTNIKVIYTAHGFHFYDGAPLKNWIFYYPIEKYLSKVTDILITINEEDYKKAQNFNAKQVEYIPGVGIDLNKINTDKSIIKDIKNKLNIKENDSILLSVGELNANKNHKIVLEALRVMKNKQIKYFICGEGHLKSELENLVVEYNLKDQVKFLGYRNDIMEVLSIADVFIFPSFREGLSKALMEAMALGKPIIASDIRGNRDLIDYNKGGLLFDPLNIDELSSCISQMIGNKSMRNKMSKYNIEKIKFYSLNNVLEKMKKIYK